MLSQQRHVRACLVVSTFLKSVRQHFHTTRDKDDDSDTCFVCGRGLYANVDKSPLCGRGHVTALDQSGLYDAECPLYFLTIVSCLGAGGRGRGHSVVRFCSQEPACRNWAT